MCRGKCKSRLHVKGFAAVSGFISSFLLIIHSASLQASQPYRLNLKTHIQPIFDANCVVCHLEGGALGNLVLEEGLAFTQLVNRESTQASLNLVEPYQVGASYLIYKLEGKHVDVGGSGKAMPFDGMELNAAEIAVIKAWIAGGAHEK